MILPMAKVRVLGPRAALPRALQLLQTEGVLEIRAPCAGDAGLVRACAAGAVGPDRAAALDAVAARADVLAARLPAAAAAPIVELLPAPGTPVLDARLAELEDAVGRLEARRAALVEEREAAERFARLVAALAPLDHHLDPALSPEIHGLVLRADPDALALVQSEVRRLTGGACEISARALDAGHTGVLIVVPRAHGRAVSALLFERGVDEVKLPVGCAGRTLVDSLLLVSARGRALPAEIAAVDAAQTELAARVGPALASIAARARGAAEVERATGRCGETRFAFVVTGWSPAERVPALRAAASADLGDAVAVIATPPAPDEWGEVPVVLRNPRPVRPFERLLALVPLPRYGSIDPTPWLAAFFPLFFGLVLGDVAFGALGIVAALLARARRWGGALGRDVAWIALACSAWALVFGVAFGEALGELGAHVGLHPLVLDRRRAILAFLGVALGLGLVHVVTGTALGVAGALRGGHVRHALGRAAKLVLILCAAATAAALAGVVPRGWVRPGVLATIVALAVAIGAEGPMAALDLVLGVGNVLSYARLMALGLASVMLAEVANTVGATLEPRAAGIAIAVLLHAVNFTLGLISPAIAALRLHYVEFFEKFYDEGGAPFRPFARAA